VDPNPVMLTPRALHNVKIDDFKKYHSFPMIPSRYPSSITGRKNEAMFSPISCAK
jgi:hypothetical protein